MTTQLAADSCPYCRFEGAATVSGVHECPRCHKALMPLFDGGGLQAWLPVQFGRYRLVAPLGRGGMGCVFEAEDTWRRARVAVKVPVQQRTWERNVKDRFDRETRLLQSINHPNVVRFLDRGKVAGHRFFVMEYVDGEDLGKVLSRHRAQGAGIPFDRVHPLLVQASSALHALHAQGIVHRDVKPSNLIVRPNGQLILIDLGIARSTRDETAETSTGATLGTWQYLAPEQVRSPASVDHRADIYSLGVVIYELLTGELPRGNVRRPSKVNPTVPAWFDQLLFQLLESSPDRRSWPIEDWGLTPDETHSVNESSPSPAQSGTSSNKRTKNHSDLPWWLSAAAAVYVVWCVLSWFVGLARQPSDKEPNWNRAENAGTPSEAWLDLDGTDTLEQLDVTEDEVLWKALGIRARFVVSFELVIEEVKVGSAASRAGLRAGDALLKLGGYRIPSKRAVANWLATLRPVSMSFTAVRGTDAIITGWLEPDR